MHKCLAMAAALLVAGGTAGAAMPLPAPLAAGAPVVPVADGCGLAFHRTFRGVCVPNGPRFYRRGPVPLLPPCPPFYHRDPDPARPICYPNL